MPKRLPVAVDWLNRKVAVASLPTPKPVPPLLAAVERITIRLVGAAPEFECTKKPSNVLPATTLSVAVAVTEPVLPVPSTWMPLRPLLYASTRLKTALTVPAPLGFSKKPTPALSATKVLDTSIVLVALGN